MNASGKKYNKKEEDKKGAYRPLDLFEGGIISPMWSIEKRDLDFYPVWII